MKKFKKIFFGILILFAIIGFVFVGVFVAMQFDLFNLKGSIKDRNESITDQVEVEDYSCSSSSENCNWNETREWKVVSGGLIKDKLIIEDVSNKTGIPPRLIASIVIPEQIRFFTSEREVFKRYFEPLKILGSLSKFSLGVSGIKQETAEKIEAYVNDPNSDFYPGEEFSELLKYQDDVNQKEELFNRLTDEKDHYYSYLYTAIFIKEILSQWEKSGYIISNKPEIISTIFNIGFDSSNPNPEPQIGGTTINLGGQKYTFGELSGIFYQSNELLDFSK